MDAKEPEAVGYIRVSTEAQASEGVSLDAQQERIKAWCELNGHALINIEVDAGISGSKATNRPGLQLAIDEACRHRAALVVYSLSRLARSTIDAIAISQRLDHAGADLVSLSEKIDTTSAAGKMVFRMLAVLAEFERDVIAERTCTALDQLRRKGRRISGRIPFGFDLAADGEMLTVNPAEAIIVERIRRQRIAGTSLRAIARGLDAAGVKPKYGASWGASSIQAILTAKARA